MKKTIALFLVSFCFVFLEAISSSSPGVENNLSLSAKDDSSSENIRLSSGIKSSFSPEVEDNLSLSAKDDSSSKNIRSFSGIKSISADFVLNKALIKQIKKQGGHLISDRVGSYILRAESLAEDKKYDQAIELLDYHYQRDTFTKAEKAQFALNIAYLYKFNKNNKTALAYFQKALDLKSLPYNQSLSALYNVSQIYVEEENYDKALKQLKFWFSINENPFPQSYILLAHCYYAKNHIQKALKYVEKTISLISKPKENWLQFAVAIYLKQKKYKKAQIFLERLVALYPANPSHWKQLAGVYLYREKRHYAFITLDMAEKMGHLKTKREYLNLSSLYMEQGLSYQGALLLKQKMKEHLIPKEQKNFEILAEAFWLAREEKSSLFYLKEAAKTAKKLLFFLKYGQRLLSLEMWLEAEKAFKTALNTKEIQKSIQEIQKYNKELARMKKLEMEKFFPNIYQKIDKMQISGQIQPVQNKKTSLGKEDNKSKGKKLIAPPTNHLEKIYFGIGMALYKQKNYEQALSYFKKSIDVDDTFVRGYQWIEWAEKSLLEQQAVLKNLGQ